MSCKWTVRPNPCWSTSGYSLPLRMTHGLTSIMDCWVWRWKEMSDFLHFLPAVNLGVTNLSAYQARMTSVCAQWQPQRHASAYRVVIESPLSESNVAHPARLLWASSLYVCHHTLIHFQYFRARAWNIPRLEPCWWYPTGDMSTTYIPHFLFLSFIWDQRNHDLPASKK